MAAFLFDIYRKITYARGKPSSCKKIEKWIIRIDQSTKTSVEWIDADKRYFHNHYERTIEIESSNIDR